MALASYTVEGRATVAFWRFPNLDLPYIRDFQKSLVASNITEYHARKEIFEAQFEYLSPVLERVFSSPVPQVQFEISEIVRESFNMSNDGQTQGPKRPWDIYHTHRAIHKHERVWKIANCMVTQYLNGAFEYSERLRLIAEVSGREWIDDKCATVLAYCLFVDLAREDIPDEETRALGRLYKSLEREASSSATSTSGSSSPSSGSSSESEEIQNFRPSNQRPNIHRVESSALADRLKAFLPGLAASNAQLASGTSGTGGFELDANSEQPHIEMNLGLGVLEHTAPSATEPLISESRSVKRKATNNGTQSHTSMKSKGKQAETRKDYRIPIRLATGSRPSSSSSSGSGNGSGSGSGSNSSRSGPRPRLKIISPLLANEKKVMFTMKLPPHFLERRANSEGVIKLQVKENLVQELAYHRAEMAVLAATKAENAKKAKTANKVKKEEDVESFPAFDQEMIDAANLDVMEQVANGKVEGFEVMA